MGVEFGAAKLEPRLACPSLAVQLGSGDGVHDQDAWQLLGLVHGGQLLTFQGAERDERKRKEVSQIGLELRVSLQWPEEAK